MELLCPYCEQTDNIEHEDCSEWKSYGHVCPHCKKLFGYEVVATYIAYTKKITAK